MSIQQALGAMVVAVSLVASPVYAAKGGVKGPAKEAYVNANENASFKGGNPGKGNADIDGVDKNLKKKLEKEIDGELDGDTNGKKDNEKDSQLEKTVKKESKKAIKKAIK